MELFQVKNKITQWWVPLVWGVLFLAVGIMVIFKPLNALVGLSAFFIAAMLISGTFGLIFAISNKNNIEHWMWYLFSALLDLIIGILLLVNPHLTVAVLIYFVGFWFLFRGVANISMSITFKKIGLKNWWLTLLGGILTIIFSFLMITNPAFGALSVVYLTSFAFLTAGFLGIILAFKIKKINKMLLL